MSGIDYAAVRRVISILQVLDLLQFVPVEESGDERRGPCPIHGSSSATSRSFAANVRKQTFRCFKCGASGNALDLWVQATQLPLHEAARDLCDRLGIDVPEIRRW